MSGQRLAVAARVWCGALGVALLVSTVLVAIAPTASAAGFCGPPVTSVIACENSLTGTPPSDWQVNGAGDSTLQGFTTASSVNVGETVQLKVKSTAATYRIDILRLGFYQGNGARKVAALAGPFARSSQSACATNSTSGLVDCGNWTVSATWTVPTTAVSGVYVAHLIRTDNGAGSLVPFVVRNEASHSDIVVQTSDTTWQAYNDYGGNSLYGCTVACPPGDPLAYKAAYKVSYNRPYNTAGDSLANWLTYAEVPMIRFLESNGYDVSYLSGGDVDARGSLLLNHGTFVSSGHDEYWSGAQRTNVEYARDHGVNLAFFSGNEVFWKTRWEADANGGANRTLVTYKDTHFDARVDPVAWTGTWRDPRFSPPGDGGKPENALTGQYFTVNSGTTDIDVPAKYAGLRMWRNTDAAALSAGQTLTLGDGIGTLGYEWDIEVDNGFRPAGLFDLSSTTSNATETFVDYGSKTALNQTSTHHLSLYRAASGALVFGAGTVQWAWGLDDANPSGRVDRNMQQATVNLLADMGAQPATLASGLTAATESTATTPPTSAISSPAPNATIADGTSVTVTGTATASASSVVAGVEVSTDGGATWHPATGTTATRTTAWTYTWVAHGNPTTTIRTRAVDDSANMESPSSGRVVSVTCPCSVWGPNVTPTRVDDGDTGSLELGVAFRADVAGTVNGIRFYKGVANTGTHVGSLWTASGALLATATFASETSSGWQQVNFSTPVAITAGTEYVASYFAPRGHYSSDATYLYAQPAPATGGNSITDSAPLHVRRSTTTAGNGLYRYSGTSVFPDSTFNGENYWVDVSFTPSGPPPAPTAPGAPTGVTAVAANASANLSWTAPANGGSTITSYTITPYIGATAQTPTTITGNPPTTTATITGLTNNTTYTFTVTATNAIGTGPASAPSNTVTPTPPTAPGAPTGVTAVAANVSANLSWTAPANGGSTITSYTITPYIGATAQTPTTITGNPPTTTATITGLTNNTTYTFTVTATNAIGTGPASAPSNTVTPALSLAPTIDTTVTVNSTTTVATTPAFNTTQPNELLVAFVAADGLTSPAQTATVTGAGLTWTRVARANTRAGTSEIWSATAPTALTGATVTSTESSTGFHQSLTVIAVQGTAGIGAVQTANGATGAPTVSLTTTKANSLVYGVGNDWDSAIAHTPGANQSIVSQWIDTAAGDTFWTQRLTQPVTNTATTVTLNDTAPTTDRWNLAAVEITPSGPPPAPTAPGAPTGVTAVAANVSANLSWTAPANGGSTITSYTITPYIGATAQTPTTITGNPPTTTATITGLTNNTTYTFTVTATNAIGTGPASAPSNTVTPTAPPAPTAPGAPTGVTAVAANASANLSWTAPANGGSTITSYTITPYIGATAQTPTTITGNPPTTTATITGLTNNTTYTFTVTATNAIGTGPASAPSNTVTPTAPPAPTAPGAPTGVTAVAANVSANLSWTAPANGGSTITSYTITPYIGATAQTPTTITGNPPTTTATITGLTNNTTYTFTVTATNAIGTGPASAPSNTVTPTAPPPAPGAPTIDTTVTVNSTTTVATTPAFNTTQPNELLVAFVAADGRNGTAQTATVTGAGLTWTRVARANTRAGTSEIWSATAPTALTGATVTSTESSTGFHQSLTVIAVQGTAGIGAVQTANGATGAPTVSLTTTKANSLVYGVGNDWDSAIAHTPGANQSIVSQWIDTAARDTFWTQRLTQPVTNTATTVTLNDTAPTNDRWNLAAIEIRAS